MLEMILTATGGHLYLHFIPSYPFRACCMVNDHALSDSTMLFKSYILTLWLQSFFFVFLSHFLLTNMTVARKNILQLFDLFPNINSND